MYYYKFKPELIKDIHTSATAKDYGWGGAMDKMLHPDWIYETTSMLRPNQQLHNDQTFGSSINASDLILVDSDDLKEILWSETLNATFDFLEHYVTEQIKNRYVQRDYPRNRQQNVVVDTFAPFHLRRRNMNMDRRHSESDPSLPKSFVAISPFIANIFGVRQIQFEQLITILGFDKNSLKALLGAVKQQKYVVHFIGYGGTGVNTIHWLNEIMNYTGLFEIFENVTVWEPEKAEISNLLRFPKDPTKMNMIQHTGHYSHKLNLLGDDLRRLATYSEVQSAFLPFGSPVMRTNYKLDEKGNRITKADGRYDIEYTYQHPKTIIYGAPDIPTREKLYELGGFISATHADAECSLHLNPIQDSNLQVESYGTIQLNQFFMNQLRMAIAFLEVLANPEFDPMQKDIELFAYSFDGNYSAKTDKKYHFNIEAITTITPEG